MPIITSGGYMLVQYLKVDDENGVMALYDLNGEYEFKIVIK